MSQSRVRRENRRRLLRSLVGNGPMPRSLIAADLNLTQAAISRLVRELIEAGVLEERNKLSAAGRPGRQHIQVGFASRSLFVVGVGFEAFSQSVVIADLNGTVIASEMLGITSFTDTHAVFDRIAEAIRKLLERARIGADRVIGVGVAVVGIVNREKGRALESSHLGWRDVPIGEELARRTGLPVVVDNLLHSTNLAEHSFGVSRGHDQVLLVRTSLSVGASSLFGHQVVRGANSLAGQIAHVSVSGAGQKCSCGATGCLETEASGRAIVARFEGRPFVRLANEDVGVLSGRLSEILAMAQNGNSLAHATVFEGGRALGTALEWPLSTADPECLVLTGPVGRHPSYVQGVAEGMASHRNPPVSIGSGLLVGHMAIREVASHLAFTEFVTARDLDLDRLGPERAETALAAPPILEGNAQLVPT